MASTPWCCSMGVGLLPGLLGPTRHQDSEPVAHPHGKKSQTTPSATGTTGNH